MRLIVMFDLPTLTFADQKNYRKFRKFLLGLGFFMFQESIYVRMVLNGTIESSVRAAIEKEIPSGGCVAILSVTEKQFSNMSFATNGVNMKMLASDKRVVII